MKLPETDITATLTFSNRMQADEFARMYGRKSLQGHSISPTKDNKTTVTIWNVTDDIKSWINNYISNIN